MFPGVTKSWWIGWLMYMQKTEQLFQDIIELARRDPSDEKTELINLLLGECELVELVQKMWRKLFTAERLEQMNDLPDHLFSSLAVSKHFALLNKTASNFGHRHDINAVILSAAEGRGVHRKLGLLCSRC